MTQTTPAVQPTAEQANDALRAYLQSLPHRSPVTPEERAVYGQLLDAWVAAASQEQAGIVLAA